MSTDLEMGENKKQEKESSDQEPQRKILSEGAQDEKTGDRKQINSKEWNKRLLIYYWYVSFVTFLSFKLWGRSKKKRLRPVISCEK